jgi:hypothetical protein
MAVREEQETPRLQNYQREDTRWEKANPARDWAILIVIAALHTLWMLLVFFFEPGIR